MTTSVVPSYASPRFPRSLRMVDELLAGILAVPLLQPGQVVAAFVVAMGALNASMNRVGHASIGAATSAPS